MAMGYAELERFYHGFVTRARERDVTCAITSGMACVAFGVAQTTKDCDLLCTPAVANSLLDLLGQTTFEGCLPSYRGHITPPLDARWLKGGWTSHFVWKVGDREAYLDIFGVAPRASAPWESELQGLYCSPHIVAEMKRTDRDKDWPFATALGVKLLEAGDARGWLHIFSYDVLISIAQRLHCPAEIVAQRPVLQLLDGRQAELEIAIKGEIEFWQSLDKVRLRCYERAVRRYMLTVKKQWGSDCSDLGVQHQARVKIAEELLPINPIGDHGIDQLIADARAHALKFVRPEALEWLPNVRSHFIGLLDE